MECPLYLPTSKGYCRKSSSSLLISSSLLCRNSSSSLSPFSWSHLTFTNLTHKHNRHGCTRTRAGKRNIRLSDALAQTKQLQPKETTDSARGNTTIVISACLVGLLTGFGVVLFNNGVHEIRDFFWDGIPDRGASWLRGESLQSTWLRVILVPASGGFIVSLLNLLRSLLDDTKGNENVKTALRPFLKALAACVTLGTGNSLGPEGPSVDIGKSMAKGVHALFDKSPQTKLSLLAAGSAAGISSGFNAAVAGCFFAVESVLWPSPMDSSVSLTNTTSMVILSAVIASVVSEVGLGSEPAFTVPDYDFRSPGELPLYLLLGILCGLVSLALTKCTSYLLVSVDNLQRATGVPRAAFPVLCGLTLVVVKVAATSLCRASGLVGGYYAPSLFIGAATGMAYGKFVSLAVAQFNPIIHLSVLEVASPQAYGLVGMAATLAGVCQVPLTSVLLLFELTQDYRIVLPLLAAVGMSSWITSGQTERRDAGERQEMKEGNIHATQQPETSSSGPSRLFSDYVSNQERP